MSVSKLFEIGFLGHYLETNGVGRNFEFYLFTILAALTMTVLPYVLGSLNFSIIISKYFYHEDIRIFGSGNAGMTNMLRTYGKGAAAITLLCDALKAVVSCLLGYVIFGIVGAYVAGLACILGHVFPVFYRFKGGKGVVTAIVTIFMTNWIVGLVIVFVFVCFVAGTKFISLGSVMGALIYPLVLDRMNGAPPLGKLLAVAMTVVVVCKHIPNIKRLMAGTENKVSFSKTDKKKTNGGADEK